MGNVTKEHILSGLRSLGVAQNDKLIVHSSLSSFGYVDGGASVVITALQEAVEKDGVIMMPTFTYGQEPFDIRNTPSKTGLITEVFRLLPDVVRSAHPGFSVAVWGEKASDIANSHLTDKGIGKGTPLHRMIESGAKILLIGVDHISNSTLHLAQDLAQAPYLNRFRMTEIIENNGNHRTFRMRRAGCSMGFNKIYKIVEESGIEKLVMIGKSPVRILPGQRFIDLATELLYEDAGFLLCDRDNCPSCQEARDMIAVKLSKGNLS